MSSPLATFDEIEVFVGDHANGTAQLDVWMDGSCTLCQASKKWCELRGSVGRVRFIDFRKTGEVDLPVTRTHHERSMWVRDSDGALLEGFAAWRRIMAELPGWRVLARFVSLPPFTLIGPPFYRLIAAHRHRLK
jgi:predicted DCC family thiol-disulfide oxidoreductase YuxK